MSDEVRRTYRFAAVPEWLLLHPDLQAIDIQVFAVLDRYAQGTKRAWPSVQTLAERLQVVDRTIQRSLRRLEQAGAVSKQMKFDEAGRQSSNTYLLAGDGPVGVTPVSGGGDSPAGGEGDTAVTRSREVRKERKATTPVSPSSGSQLELVPPSGAQSPSAPPKKSRRAPQKPMPDPWELGDGKTVEIAKRRYVDIFTADREFAAFKAYHLGHGSRFADWEAAWNLWLINRERFQQERAK